MAAPIENGLQTSTAFALTPTDQQASSLLAQPPSSQKDFYTEIADWWHETPWYHLLWQAPRPWPLFLERSEFSCVILLWNARFWRKAEFFMDEGKTELVKSWLSKADHDLKTAKKIYQFLLS